MTQETKEEIQSPEIAAKKPQKSRIPESWLKDWGLTYTWKSTIILYLAIGIVSFAYGLLISSMNSTVTEVYVEYGKYCGNQTSCDVPVTVPRDMKQPVFFYYELDNFYQNHRLYIMSKSNAQLHGTVIEEKQADKECGKDAKYNWQMDKYLARDNKTALVNTSIAHPCGFIAKTFFNDTFKLFSPTNNEIYLNDSNILWPYVKGKVYENPANYEDKAWMDVEDSHFMVWMKTGVFSDGRRLWAKIEQDLPAGDYFVKVNNIYPADRFNAQKALVLATANIFGGKVEFLASTFMIIGMIFVLISMCFFNRSKETRRVNFVVRGVTN